MAELSVQHLGTNPSFFKAHFLHVGALKAVEGKVSATNHRVFCRFYKIGSLNLDKSVTNLVQTYFNTSLYHIGIDELLGKALTV